MGRHCGWSATLYRAGEILAFRAVLRRMSIRHGPPVDVVAAALGVRVLNVEDHNSPEALAVIAAEQPEIGLMGGVRILKPAVIRLFPQGIYGAHPGLLPNYRGNYVSRWALLNGDPIGYTIYRVNDRLDAGPIIKAVLDEMRPGMALCFMEERIIKNAGEALAPILVEYFNGALTAIPQDLSQGKTYKLMPVRKVFELHRKLSHSHFRFFVETSRREL